MDSKILISWIAYGNDFNQDITFNMNGPTATFHRYHLDKYEKHYWLMSWNMGDNINSRRESAIYEYIKLVGMDKKIIPVFIEIKDPVSIIEVREKLEKKLIELGLHHKNCDVFISPGTPTMMVVWYFLAVSGQYKFNLFQVRRPEFAEGKIEPEYIQIDNTIVPHTLYIKSVATTINLQDEICLSDSIKPIYEMAEKAAMTDEIPILILGENGTGKENLARFIHEHSARKDKPFVAVNCSSLTDTLIESRLFGYVRGAFTGAIKDTKGFFESANGGTLFLDEIGDISPFMQQSLLRVLQEKKIIMLGDTVEKKVNVRIICATNKDLLKMTQEGKFREDLYYRIAAAELELPPLRKRGKSEIEKYFNFLVLRHKPSGQKVFILSEEAKKILFNYSFPGNIRELINLIYKLYLLQKEIIMPSDLPPRILENRFNMSSWKLTDIEREHIVRAMAYFNGNKQKVAEELGISYTTLFKKIKDYRIEWLP